MIFLQDRTQSGANENTMEAMLVAKREINGFTSMET